NLRLDTTLPGMALNSGLCTIESIPDGGGGYLPGDPLTLRTYTLPESVLNGLQNLGLPVTAGGLVELANRGLAGLYTGGASLSDITMAADAINKAFDGCKFMVPCGSN